jgi:diacylglycerol kinase family enzyme
MTTPPGGDAPPLIVVNPHASLLIDPNRRQRVVGEVARAVERRFGREPRIAAGTIEAAEAAMSQSIGAPLIVVVGGDGTVRQAAELLAGVTTPLAIVPGGTGNVLAGTLGIHGIGPAVGAIRAGATRSLDLGRARWRPVDEAPSASSGIHERTFVVACGMGLDARIMAAAEHEWKRRMRFGAYVGAAIRELVRLESATFRIVADGDPFEVVGYLVLVANAGDLVPGRIGPRQQIDPTDGRLDLIVLGGTGPIDAAHSAAELMLRLGEQQGRVIRRLVSHVEISADPPQPIETDGDHHPSGRLEASVVPGAITVLVPAGTR